MTLAESLFSVLASGAKIVASGAVTEFAKGAGKSAFEALKTRLTAKHGVKSLPLLDDATGNASLETAIKTELEKPDIATDAEVLRLAETLREAIAALPAETLALYAVNIDKIQSDGALSFEAVEGVKAKAATSQGDMTFTNIKAPPGKA